MPPFNPHHTTKHRKQRCIGPNTSYMKYHTMSAALLRLFTWALIGALMMLHSPSASLSGSLSKLTHANLGPRMSSAETSAHRDRPGLPAALAVRVTNAAGVSRPGGQDAPSGRPARHRVIAIPEIIQMAHSPRFVHKEDSSCPETAFTGRPCDGHQSRPLVSPRSAARRMPRATEKGANQARRRGEVTAAHRPVGTAENHRRPRASTCHPRCLNQLGSKVYGRPRPEFGNRHAHS